MKLLALAKLIYFKNDKKYKNPDGGGECRGILVTIIACCSKGAIQIQPSACGFFHHLFILLAVGPEETLSGTGQNKKFDEHSSSCPIISFFVKKISSETIGIFF